MKRKFLIALVLLSSFLATGQSVKLFAQAADQVFNGLDQSDAPGVASGIIKDGQVIYLKGFGIANLERKTPITPQTMFQLGEMSKQFTSLAILICEEEGIISLEDPIHNLITELPIYEHTITIRHLLNHTSGLHDINRIATILNGSPSVKDQKKALELIAAQKSLAFQPGTVFSFHEAATESVLMAEIVARSSGESFADFVTTRIFEPLGMKNSLIRTDSRTILSECADAYLEMEDGTYLTNEVSSSVIGAINAYSSAEDMTKWYLQFTHPTGALGNLIRKLDSPVQLDNGKEYDYYWGKMAVGREFSHPERGIPIYWNFGFQGGYGTNIFRFKNEKITTFVLGNNNQFNGGLAMDAVDTLVKDKYLVPPVIDYENLKTVTLTTDQLKAFEGNYWFHPAGYATKIFVENDTLRNQWLFGSKHNTLLPIAGNTFQQVGNTDEVRRYKFVKDGNKMNLRFRYDESEEDLMVKYVPAMPSIEVLQSYIGTYYSDAYRSLILVEMEEDELTVSNIGHSGIRFRAVKKDVFSSATAYMPAMEFLRNSNDEVHGVKFDGDGVHSLHFTKVK